MGERVILENLPGGHWTDRHNSMEQEMAAICAYAGLPAEREPFGLFGHLIPNRHSPGSSRTREARGPDLRIDMPPITIKIAIKQTTTTLD